MKQKLIITKQPKQKSEKQSKIFQLLEELATREEKISLPTSRGLRMEKFTDIMYCEADGCYTTFVLRDNTKIIVSKNIGSFEIELTKHHFIRIHASHIVNPGYVIEYINGRGGEVIMDDKKLLPVSRTHRDELIDTLKYRHTVV
jgi:two-component system LytT family response regulator